MGNIGSISLSCDTIIFRCWDAVTRQTIYTRQLEENLPDLNTALLDLKEQRNDVVRKVNIAEQQNLKPLDVVVGWLSRSETMINEIDVLLLDGPEKIENLCMGGCCSKDYKSTLKFSKRVAKRLRDVKDLKSNGAFEVVAIEVPTASVVKRPTDSVVALESMFNKVWNIFEEKNNVGIIGLYGVGGVGKTRLLTEINNTINISSKSFDSVIWVVVSKGFYIAKIQDDIAKRIGLFNEKWKDKTLEEKAMDIFGILSKKKFVLLLDDIWERVDLSKVGVPLPTPKHGSKLIFTTRSIQVCGQMRAHQKIEVQCLNEENAWKLFEEHVGHDTLNSHSNIRELAQQVAKECGGLPLALITIGRAMACKNTPEEWGYTIEVLKKPGNLPNMGEEVYPRLKFSYDSLPNDMFRTCLLYCSLFPEDQVIYKKWLIDYWIGEGFLNEHDSIGHARNQGHHIISCLIHACLLEEAYSDYIKMHDVIRDMCLWIACSREAEKWKFFVQAGYDLKVPQIEECRGAQRMSLMKNNIETLTEAPNCPDLQTLFLNDNLQLKVIRDGFFQFMSGLKVLSFKGCRGITELSVGIAKLVSLEFLDLSSTSIKELPIELKALEKLKVLNLNYLTDGIKVSKGLIFRLSKLQILRMYASYLLSENEVVEWLLEEFQSLNQLNVLCLTLVSAFALDKFLRAERLHSYIEDIGLWSLEDSKQLNILSLANLKSLNHLSLYKCCSLDEVKMEWNAIKAERPIQTSMIATHLCFQSLCHVCVRKCPKLTDITWLILAPNLRIISVKDCHNMEEIINELKSNQVAELMRRSTPFSSLKYIQLLSLPNLKSIYWDALPLSCLEEICVSKCPKLRRLPLNSHSAKGNKFRIDGEEEWWKELQWEDESIGNAFLPCFTAT